MSINNSGIRDVNSSFYNNKNSMGNNSVSSANEKIKIDIEFENCSTKFKDLAVTNAIKSLKIRNKNEKFMLKEMAQLIKENMEEILEIPKSLNVIVGKNFGSYVSFEQNGIIMFWINNYSFLIWKFG